MPAPVATPPKKRVTAIRPVPVRIVVPKNAGLSAMLTQLMRALDDTAARLDALEKLPEPAPVEVQEARERLSARIVELSQKLVDCTGGVGLPKAAMTAQSAARAPAACRPRGLGPMPGAGAALPFDPQGGSVGPAEAAVSAQAPDVEPSEPRFSGIDGVDDEEEAEWWASEGDDD